MSRASRPRGSREGAFQNYKPTVCISAHSLTFVRRGLSRPASSEVRFVARSRAVSIGRAGSRWRHLRKSRSDTLHHGANDSHHPHDAVSIPHEASRQRAAETVAREAAMTHACGIV